jgi:hypothetical protein
MLARDKHSDLLRIFVNCGRKSFITFGPEVCYKTFYGRNCCHINISARVLAIAIHFHPSLIFAGMDGAFQSGVPYGKLSLAHKY